MIGDAGLTPAVLREIDTSLRSHELIKIRVFGDKRAARQTLIDSICARLDAAAVQHIGKILVVYRPRPDDTPPSPRGKVHARGSTAAARGPRAKQGPRRTKRSFQTP